MKHKQKILFIGLSVISFILFSQMESFADGNANSLLLLHFDNDWLDSSTNGTPITVSATGYDIYTPGFDSAEKKFGSGSSLYLNCTFEGTINNYYVEIRNKFENLYSGDWTIDFWAKTNTEADINLVFHVPWYHAGKYVNDSGDTKQRSLTIYLKQYTIASGWRHLYFYSTHTGGLKSFEEIGGQYKFNQWNHFAVVNYGGSGKMYINGNEIQSFSFVTENDTNDTWAYPKIFGGRDPDPLPPGETQMNRQNFWLDEFHVSDTALWINNFSVPTNPW